MRPATPGTIKVINKIIRKFLSLGWEQRRVRDLPLEAIETKFRDLVKAHPSATEQAFRWVTAVVTGSASACCPPSTS